MSGDKDREIGALSGGYPADASFAGKLPASDLRRSAANLRGRRSGEEIFVALCFSKLSVSGLSNRKLTRVIRHIRTFTVEEFQEHRHLCALLVNETLERVEKGGLK